MRADFGGILTHGRAGLAIADKRPRRPGILPCGGVTATFAPPPQRPCRHNGNDNGEPARDRAPHLGLRWRERRVRFRGVSVHRSRPLAMSTRSASRPPVSRLARARSRVDARNESSPPSSPRTRTWQALLESGRGQRSHLMAPDPLSEICRQISDADRRRRAPRNESLLIATSAVAVPEFG
jgi:hypothetical protein